MLETAALENSSGRPIYITNSREPITLSVQKIEMDRPNAPSVMLSSCTPDIEDDKGFIHGA